MMNTRTAKVYFFHDLVVYLCNFHFRGRIALVQRGRAFRVNLVRRGIHDGKSGALHFAVAYSLFYIGRFNRVTPKFVTIEEQTSFLFFIQHYPAFGYFGFDGLFYGFFRTGNLGDMTRPVNRCCRAINHTVTFNYPE